MKEKIHYKITLQKTMNSAKQIQFILFFILGSVSALDINSDVNPDENDRLFSTLLQHELDNSDEGFERELESSSAEPHIEEIGIGERLEKFGEDIKNKITYLVRKIAHNKQGDFSSSGRGEYYQVPVEENDYLEMAELSETDELLFEEDKSTQSVSYTQSNIRKRK